jgi:anthranilate phosphoribosyltransferase
LHDSFEMAAVKQALQAMVAEKRAISAEEAQAAMHDLFTGSSTQAQTGAFLTSLQRQVLDPEVLRACAEAMLSFASPCKVKSKQDLMDIVGTGGDGLDSFNVSTAAGIVLAASGIKCAKHGNRSASGSVGSADFLEALGCNIKLDGDQVAEAIDECGFGFLFAQMFHPAMEHVAAARKEVGGWTIFNLLGPLTNPAEPELQVIGVGKKELGMLFAEMFKAKGAKKAIIVHSSEGLDEISPSSTTFAWILDCGEITEKELSPADFGLEAHALELVTGGSAGDRATIFREILHSGKKREHDNALVRKALRNSASHLAIKDYIIINAAPAIFLAGKAKDLKSAADIGTLEFL